MTESTPPDDGPDDPRTELAIAVLRKQLSQFSEFNWFSHYKGGFDSEHIKPQIQTEGERLKRWKERTVAALGEVLTRSEVEKFSWLEVSAVQYPSPVVLRNNLNAFSRHLRALLEEAEKHPDDFVRLRVKPIHKAVPVEQTPVEHAVPVVERQTPQLPVTPPQRELVLLSVPERVTFGWLWHNVAWTVWVGAGVVLLTVFALGWAVGSGKSFPEILDIVVPGDLSSPEATSPELKSPAPVVQPTGTRDSATALLF